MYVIRSTFRPLVAVIVSIAYLTSPAIAEELDAGMTTVQGQLFYRERIASLPDSVATITLNDVSRADAPAIRVAGLTLLADRIPVSFSMGVATDRLNDRARYAVRGTITDPNGELLWTTDTAYMVDAAKGLNDLGMMRLVRVAQDGRDEVTTHAVFMCGEKPVRARFSGETLTLEVDGQHHQLTQTWAASGARYADAAGEVMFWDKGENALLDLGAVAPVECTRVEADTLGQPSLTAAPWGVEDIEGRGVIDNSQTTLAFGADNHLSGRAGCNTYTGSYSVSNDSLTVDNVAVTSKACLAALAHQEAAFLDILNQLQAFRFNENGALLLSDGAGRSITAQR